MFKIATLVNRSLSGHAPGYLADDCQRVTDARAKLLRSTDTRTLNVHRTSSFFRDRSFAAAATTVWNSLPSGVRRSLKTFLFGQSDHGALWTLLTAPFRNILTYLLTATSKSQTPGWPSAYSIAGECVSGDSVPACVVGHPEWSALFVHPRKNRRHAVRAQLCPADLPTVAGIRQTTAAHLGQRQS